MPKRIRVIGAQASLLATKLGVWRRIEEVRDSAERADDVTFAFQVRQDVEVLTRALSNVLGIHEPRDGSPNCPSCSTKREPTGWPCPTWDLARQELLREVP